MKADNTLGSLLERLPPEVLANLTEEERIALWQAANPSTWRRHPINIRLTIPGLSGRYFLTVVGGVERRSSERIRRERKLHRLFTVGNLLFLLGVGGGFYAAAALVVLGFLLLMGR